MPSIEQESDGIYHYCWASFPLGLHLVWHYIPRFGHIANAWYMFEEWLRRCVQQEQPTTWPWMTTCLKLGAVEVQVLSFSLLPDPQQLENRAHGLYVYVLRSFCRILHCNDKTLFWEIKEGLNKWRDIPFMDSNTQCHHVVNLTPDLVPIKIPETFLFWG